MKIIHVLANGPPDVNGYAIRTQMILKHQKSSMNVIGLTSPWYPQRESMIDDYQLDGIDYYRTVHPLHRKEKIPVSHRIIRSHSKKELNKASQSVNRNKKPSSNIFVKAIRAPGYFARIGWKVVEEKILIKYFTKRIIEVAKQENAEVIHAHTPYRVGLPALKAARKLRLPFVYEMRGMWEETAVANGRWLRNGPAYRRFQKFETRVLRKADAVVCISQTLKQEAISRGVEEAKITVVTNAVESDIAENNTKGETYEKSVTILSRGKSTKVIGYIGSLREMEGVDLTAQAVARLKSDGHDVRLFVLTSQAGQIELKQYCDSLGLDDDAVIVGPVPHEQVGPFYDLIDIFVVSRPDTRVTRLVTPLKPFEAMAMSKAVIASKLPALEEIIEDGKTGLLYEPGSVDSLRDAILACLNEDDLAENLGHNAKEWVMNNRTWNLVVKNYQVAYQFAIDSMR